MAIHQGFEDLSQGRRVALMRLRDQVIAQREGLHNLIKKARGKHREELQRIADRFTDLVELIDLQFPKIRILQDNICPEMAADTTVLARNLKFLQTSVADALGIDAKIVREYLRTCGEILSGKEARR